MLRPPLHYEVSQKRSNVNGRNLQNGYIFLPFYEYCERTEAEIFLSIFVQKQSSGNGCWIYTNKDKFENGVDWT